MSTTCTALVRFQGHVIFHQKKKSCNSGWTALLCNQTHACHAASASRFCRHVSSWQRSGFGFESACGQTLFSAVRLASLHRFANICKRCRHGAHLVPSRLQRIPLQHHRTSFSNTSLLPPRFTQNTKRLSFNLKHKLLRSSQDPAPNLILEHCPTSQIDPEQEAPELQPQAQAASILPLRPCILQRSRHEPPLHLRRRGSRPPTQVQLLRRLCKLRWDQFLPGNVCFIELES